MHRIPSFWAAAARLSGRVDFSTLVAADVDPATASNDTLREHGVSKAHVLRLRRSEWLESPAPAILLTDEHYPAWLRSLPFAPPVLFLDGDPSLLQETAAAIVGARRCSEPARQFAQRVAEDVVRAGGVVVSGLAWGIDDAAHRGAEGRTVAVVAQGLGVPFSGALAERAARLRSAGGLIVSEFPPERRPDRSTFPQRNRVISGLAKATVVIEAGERSGSLITARCALEQGRELFVVPDHPTRVHAAGGLALLETGIAPLLGPGPLLEALGLQSVAVAAGNEGVLALVARCETPTALAEHTGESVRSWLRRLASLELSGQVERLPGGRFAPTSPRTSGGSRAPATNRESSVRAGPGRECVPGCPRGSGAPG